MKKEFDNPVKKIPAYIERMLDERNDLVNKIDKLSNFISKDEFNDLPDIKQQLLFTQLNAMNSYENVLRLRIYIEDGQITSLKSKEFQRYPTKSKEISEHSNVE